VIFPLSHIRVYRDDQTRFVAAVTVFTVASVAHVALMTPDAAPFVFGPQRLGRGAGLPPVTVTTAVDKSRYPRPHTLWNANMTPALAPALTLDPRPCAPGVRAVGAGGAGLQRLAHAGVVDPVRHRLHVDNELVNTSELARAG